MIHIENLIIDSTSSIKEKESPNINDTNFIRWFGNSKVKDEEGNPLVVYHGSTIKFSSFKNNEKYMLDRMVGYHFAKDIEIARTFVGSDDDVYKVYLKIENPLVIPKGDGFDQNLINKNIMTIAERNNDFKQLFLDWFHRVYSHMDWYKEKLQEFEKTGKITLIYSGDKTKTYTPLELIENYDIGLHMGGDKFKPRLIAMFLDQCKKEGYDGVIYQNTSPMETAKAKDATCYIVFYPNQIKSIDNNGEWNPSSDNINEKITKIHQYIKERSQLNNKFWIWFGDSKVVDSSGNPLVVYHGTQRPDRVSNKFDPKRATSGPMAFFTDSPEVASKYATQKHDSSVDQTVSYADWFLMKLSSMRSLVPIDKAWFYLSSAEKQAIAENLPHVIDTNEQGDSGGTIRLDKSDFGVTSENHWKHTINQHKGNVLAAALDIWVESGNLFDQEHIFMNVLQAAGINNVKFESPLAEYPGVYPVYISIQNPLDTSDIPNNLVSALKDESKRKRASNMGVDSWSKINFSGAQWMAKFNNDRASGTTMVWQSIPDWVTKVLKRFSYDGIKDTGGKRGDVEHTVWIPFNPTQIKSIYNKGTWNKSSKKIDEHSNVISSLKKI